MDANRREFFSGSTGCQPETPVPVRTFGQKASSLSYRVLEALVPSACFLCRRLTQTPLHFLLTVHMKLLSKGLFAAIFSGGLLAGIFDLTQAFIGFSLMGSTPFRILQAVAGGIFGRHAPMGWTSAAIGLLCHFTVAFGAATVYYVVSRKLRVLVQRRPIRYHLRRTGISVHVLRGYPLSAIGHVTYNLATYITGPIGHPFLVGLPIVLCVRRLEVRRQPLTSPARTSADKLPPCRNHCKGCVGHNGVAVFLEL